MSDTLALGKKTTNELVLPLPNNSRFYATTVGNVVTRRERVGNWKITITYVKMIGTIETKITSTKFIQVDHTSTANGERKQTMKRKTVITKRTIKTYLHQVILDASLEQF